MSGNGVSGKLGRDAYDRLANLHRPSDPEQINAEIHRLAQDGLKAQDIAAALRLDPAMVINVLAERQPK